jgi:sodium transport system permease protein
MSRLGRMLVVVRKELRDAIRDRRAIYSVLFGSLFGPIVVAIMFNGMAERRREIEDVTVPVVGMEHAPPLVEWLRQQAGVTVVPGPAAPEAAVRDGHEDVVVVIPVDYLKRFRASRPVEVQLISDGSRSASRPKVQRVRSLLQRYNGEVASLRLIGRGVSPAVVTPIRIDDREVSSAQQRAAVILNFIPLFIVLAAFTGGMQIATDSTAGERERGSLEPLLVNPAPRTAIAGGKWLAAAASAALSVALTTVLCLLMLRVIPLEDLGIRFRLGPAQVAAILAAALPLCLLSAGLQTYLSTFARSYKEAQTYMGYLIMVPALPGLLSSVYPITSRPWMYPIPILGQHLLASDVLGGKLPAPIMFVLAALAAAATAVLLVALTTRMLQRERVVFGR